MVNPAKWARIIRASGKRQLGEASTVNIDMMGCVPYLYVLLYKFHDTFNDHVNRGIRYLKPILAFQQHVQLFVKSPYVQYKREALL
jgi:hypothetical protein